MEAGKELDRVDIYMANSTRTGIKRDAWEVLDAPNPALKIPIVFYKQQATEWNDVQTLIDRIEDSLSKNADTNDYFGSPAVKIKGTVTKMPDKGEVGKLFQLKAENVNGTMTYGDIEYMTWDRMPESIKMEYETLKELIYSQTFTPDLSFNNIKGSGNLSGIALKFMFMDAMLKASNKRDILSEGIERRISLFKALVGNVTEVTTKAILDAAIIEFEYSEIAPDNISELVDMLVVATGNKPIISQKTAVGLNPLIQDAEVEVAELQSEVTLAAEAAAVPAGESFSANV
jgi:SPP1 family phage portal protein